MAELEARKLKYPNTGTEALLMGILVEGQCLFFVRYKLDEICLLHVMFVFFFFWVGWWILCWESFAVSNFKFGGFSVDIIGKILWKMSR